MTDLIEKRSVVITGQKTSVSLEAAFWREAKRLAGLDGLTMSQFVAGIDRDRHGRNLSSSIRIAVLERVQHERDLLRDTLKPRLTPNGDVAGAAELALRNA